MISLWKLILWLEMYDDCYFNRYTDIFAMEMCCFWTDSPLFIGPALWHILHASSKERRLCDYIMPTAKLTMLILMVMKWMLIFLRMKWLAVKLIIFVCQHFRTISYSVFIYIFLIVHWFRQVGTGFSQMGHRFDAWTLVA